MTEPSDALENLVGSFRPHERLGVSVGDLDVPTDGRLQLPRAAMHTPAQLLLGQRREPALDEIDPRGAGRREMQVEARMARQPAMDRWRLVRARVVEDQVYLERGGNARMNGVEKFPELARPLAPPKFRDQFAAVRVEGREQRRRAVARGVVRAPL